MYLNVIPCSSLCQRELQVSPPSLAWTPSWAMVPSKLQDVSCRRCPSLSWALGANSQRGLELIWRKHMTYIYIYDISLKKHKGTFDKCRSHKLSHLVMACFLVAFLLRVRPCFTCSSKSWWAPTKYSKTHYDKRLPRHAKTMQLINPCMFIWHLLHGPMLTASSAEIQKLIQTCKRANQSWN